ncbi:hypothetical protein B0H13DRAFT_1852081 [Mycena leptocephala]|nr:hypothetical protein B0H13DRAFT_1852081 [Mycena leptocephala]
MSVKDWRWTCRKRRGKPPVRKFGLEAENQRGASFSPIAAPRALEIDAPARVWECKELFAHSTTNTPVGSLCTGGGGSSAAAPSPGQSLSSGLLIKSRSTKYAFFDSIRLSAASFPYKISEKSNI